VKCKATRRGDVELTLDAAEAELLRGLPEQLRELYEAPAGDPAHDRLFPRAYLDPTEDRAEQEWQALTHPGILRDRFDALDRLLATLDAAEPRRSGLRCTLTPEETSVWAQILNDARLALGTRLGITDDTELRFPDRDDPEAYPMAVYGWLTALQGALVEALLGSLPD
jgi:hypothetical protein